MTHLQIVTSGQQADVTEGPILYRSAPGLRCPECSAVVHDYYLAPMGDLTCLLCAVTLGHLLPDPVPAEEAHHDLALIGDADDDSPLPVVLWRTAASVQCPCGRVTREYVDDSLTQPICLWCVLTGEGRAITPVDVAMDLFLPGARQGRHERQD